MTWRGVRLVRPAVSQPPLSSNALTGELTALLRSPVTLTSFGARAQRIEELEAHVIERLAVVGAPLPPELHALHAEALALRERLETRNARFVERLRARIANGAYTRAGLLRAFARLADPQPGVPGYDALDELFADLFDAGELPELHAQLEPEMVAYQPTPARVILALIERAALSCEDVLCDVGSGLGHVLLASALLSGARGVGVELEPAYCAHAARSARRLRLPQLTFMAADAREAPLDEANVFYLYTPFRGQLLDDVLARLKREATRRPLVICSYGPCTPVVAQARWLEQRQPADLNPHELHVFDSVL